MEHAPAGPGGYSVEAAFMSLECTAAWLIVIVNVLVVLVVRGWRGRCDESSFPVRATAGS